MALTVLGPGDWVGDDGRYERLYPVPKEEDMSVIMYDQRIQHTSYIQANVVAVFDEWFRSFFEPNYFKFTRIRTQSTVSDFKSFMKQIYKKEMPFLVIDPRSIEHVEESIFGQNMINRFNMIDPKHENIGAKLLYSIDIMRSDIFQMVYRRNRYRFEFDIMIMERTMDRQINTFNNMLMNFRHNSKFLIARTVPHLLPSIHIQNIAKWHGFNYRSDEFLTFLNSISRYPIIRRILPNDQVVFFMKEDLHIQVEVPGIPSRDTPEMSAAIEWGARVTESFTFIADLPSEFLLLTEEEDHTKFDNSIPDDPDSIHYISPVYADLDWPTEINGYTLTNKLDLMVQPGEDPSLNVISQIAAYDESICRTIMEFIAHGGPLSDLVIVRVYPNGSMQEAQYTFDDQGKLTILNPVDNKLYTANIYVNHNSVNMIRDGKTTEFIGTIEKTDY